MALAVAVNVLEFPRVEADLGMNYRAINSYHDADAISLAANHSSTVRERFQLYLELRRWAEGADVLAASGSRLQRDQLVGLSGIGRLEYWAGDQELTEDEHARITAHTVVEGEERAAGPYALAVLDRDVLQLVTFRQPDRLLLVDARLLERVPE